MVDRWVHPMVVIFNMGSVSVTHDIKFFFRFGLELKEWQLTAANTIIRAEDEELDLYSCQNKIQLGRGIYLRFNQIVFMSAAKFIIRKN